MHGNSSGVVAKQLLLELHRIMGKSNESYYSILGLYRGNGQENGNYDSILGLYRDNGQEHGNYGSSFFHALAVYELKSKLGNGKVRVLGYRIGFRV